MVYLDGDSDLDAFARRNLEQMTEVGSTGAVNIIVQFDGFGPDTPAVRYKVEKGSLTKLADLGEINTASTDAISNFLTSSITSFPAAHYALILWDHGDGWKGMLSDWGNNGVKSPEFPISAIAGGIRTAETTTGRKIDIIGIDACIMATVEAAYEFKDVADFLVASQELVQLTGWDYQGLFSSLMADPLRDPENMARLMVDSYQKYIESNPSLNDSRSQTISAVRLGAKIEAVAQAVDQVAGKLIQEIQDTASLHETLSRLTNVRLEVQKFDLEVHRDTYVDLFNLATLLGAEGEPIQKAIGDAVVTAWHGTARPGASGISIVFPNLQALYDQAILTGYSGYDPDYINAGGTRAFPAAFLDAFSWPKLLDTYYKAQFDTLYRTLQLWPT